MIFPASKSILISVQKRLKKLITWVESGFVIKILSEVSGALNLRLSFEDNLNLRLRVFTCVSYFIIAYWFI